ncbi:sigma-54-dependent Fis family transcriptional regulator [Paenibacillus selenitireducens]|uniref:Sigma-54-dependent Fis family transcriptional regulator n=2 Tax=Paenibacillus selenitireducens TaxID=1324314 RepID=A0A1T2XBD1_9BACL|nr:sigma-54-dependent Fis family transcriptional regulator [Paenibacillus selenitireducens]
MRIYLEALLEAINDAVTIVDQEGTVLYWNRVAEEAYHISRDVIIGRKIGDFFRRESVMLFQVMESGQAVYQVYHEPRPDMHVMINTVPIYDEQQQLAGAISIERNVSQYVKLNAELSRKPDIPFALDSTIPFKVEQLSTISLIGLTDIPLLLTGEEGVGKHAISEWIHSTSGRTGAFVTMNCASIPEGLLEAELFGYQGEEERLGKFDVAMDGTLLLKNIHTLPLTIQEKLAETLRTRSFHRVGGSTSIPLHCRLIATAPSNMYDVSESVIPSSEKFMGICSGLYYTFQQEEIPPLRDRKQDLTELSTYLLVEACQRLNKPVPSFSAEAVAALVSFDWPGNLPQLKNAMEHIALVVQTGHTVLSRDFPVYARLPLLHDMTEKDMPLNAHAEELERARIVDSLQRAGGNKAKAARMLSISRGALYYKLKQYGLE